MGQHNTILVRGNLSNWRREFVASAALSPGHALARASTGKVAKNTTEGARWSGMVAIEDALQGKTVSDAFAADDPVQTHISERGNVVQMLADPGVAYAIGDKLILSGTAGQVKKASAVSTTTIEANVIGEVDEARDLSGTGAVAALVKVLVY